MSSEIEDNDAARYAALEAVEQAQRAASGRPVPVLDIIDRLTGHLDAERKARATTLYSVVLMDLASNKYGYLRSGLPATYCLTRKGWEEGMSRDPAGYPWDE